MKNTKTFEEAMAELEASVSRLESGSLSLDDSLVEFEKAVKLIKFCNDKISTAEQKVKILIEKNGMISDEDFPQRADET